MAEAKYVARMRADFDERIVPATIEKFGYKNRMEVPRLDKIVINMGVGEATQDKKKVEIALPRVRDFRGLNPKSFDGRGNYAMGLKEQLVFPEINYDRIEKVRGMD